MNMLSLQSRLLSRLLSIALFSFLLTACSPHPATGVWKTTGDNVLGIDRIVVGFEGRAEFITKKQDNSVWHCFWGVSDEKQLSFDCTPSTNPEQKKSFVLGINDEGLAELRENAKLLATFTRSDENPSPKK